MDLNAFENLLKTALDAGIDPSIFSEKFESVKAGVDISDEDWETFVETLNEKLEELELPPIELDVKTGDLKKEAKGAKDEVAGLFDGLSKCSSAIGSLGNALTSLTDDEGVAVMSIIMEAIANVAAAFASSLKGTVSPWDFIAGAISGAATMISTIAAIKSATQGFAEGGMVGGNSYSGDNIVARLNSGEGVLTAQGVQNAAAIADNASTGSNIQVTGKLSGKDIVFVASNYQRGKGVSGQYVQTH